MTTQRPFRFGACGFPARSRKALVTLSRVIEDLGYATLLVADHFDPELLDPWLTLLTAAEATTKLRLGTCVCDNDFRHPAMLAKEAATLDLLSEGRLELGIGAGWKAEDYTATHIPFDPPNIRVSRLMESVEMVKRLFTEDAVTFSGTYYQLDRLEGWPKPIQKPYPPLFIGGGGKRLLSFAGREADIVGIVMRASRGALDTDMSSHAVAQKVEWVRQAAGTRFEQIELNILTFHVEITDHRDQVAEQLATEWGIPIESALDSPHFLIGSIDQIVEQIRMCREHYGISYFIVLPMFTHVFAPVVARLAGQ